MTRLERLRWVRDSARRSGDCAPAVSIDDLAALLAVADAAREAHPGEPGCDAPLCGVTSGRPGTARAWCHDCAVAAALAVVDGAVEEVPGE